MRFHVLASYLGFLATIAIAGAPAEEPLINFDSASTLYGAMKNDPSVVGTDNDNTPFCMTSADAAIIGKSFGLLISSYTTELAVKLLASEFIDQADSVNTLINTSPLPHQPLGSLTFDSKQAFLDGQGAQPPVPFDILNTWNTCDTVILRWRSHQKPDQVQGVSIAIVRPVMESEEGGVGATGKYQIKTIFAEFNSGAWLNNLGNPECNKKNFKGWEVDVDETGGPLSE